MSIRNFFEFSEGLSLNSFDEAFNIYLITLLKLFKKFFKCGKNNDFYKDLKNFLKVIKDNLQYKNNNFEGGEYEYYVRIFYFCNQYKKKEDEIFENFRIYFEFENFFIKLINVDDFDLETLNFKTPLKNDEKINQKLFNLFSHKTFFIMNLDAY